MQLRDVMYTFYFVIIQLGVNFVFVVNQILKTQRILSRVTFKTQSDYKEVGIFELKNFEIYNT